MTNTPAPTTPDYPSLEAQITANCKEAGLEVMDQILGIIWNRESVLPETLAALDPAEIEDLYFFFISPAIDRMEDNLSGKN